MKLKLVLYFFILTVHHNKSPLPGLQHVKCQTGSPPTACMDTLLSMEAQKAVSEVKFC